MIVMKLGGSSIGDAAKMKAAAELITKYARCNKVVVVVSALSGVTDLLIEATQLAAQGKSSVALQITRDVYSQHDAILRELRLEQQRPSLSSEMRGLACELEMIIQHVSASDREFPSMLDTILAFGERLSCRLLATTVKACGQQAVAVEATNFLITDDHFGSATPLPGPTRAKATEVLMPLLVDGLVPVVTGFIGSTKEGHTTTLGRNGSDYSASIIAQVLDAEELVIWTDVDGIMTADPRMVDDARVLRQISYSEATELSYYGANILHPRTMAPLVGSAIPVSVRNSMHPNALGTQIVAEATQHLKPTVVITSVSPFDMITVYTAGIRNPAVLTQCILSPGVNSRPTISLMCQLTSAGTVHLIAPVDLSRNILESLEYTLAENAIAGPVGKADIRFGVSIVAVIGLAVSSKLDLLARALQVLRAKQIEVLMVVHDSSLLTSCIAIPSEEEQHAVRTMHDTLIQESYPN